MGSVASRTDDKYSGEVAAYKDENMLMKKQREIENWLTEIEIRLIQLQPYASCIEDLRQTDELQVVTMRKTKLILIVHYDN